MGGKKLTRRRLENYKNHLDRKQFVRIAQDENKAMARKTSSSLASNLNLSNGNYGEDILFEEALHLQHDNL